MKASKRRARERRKSKQAPLTRNVEAAFSPVEEAFFREGAALCAASSSDTSSADTVERFADLDDPRRVRPSLWQRLFARGQAATRAVTRNECMG
ncbi:MAG: hypothetical protein H0T89_07805 [Deltaproteobacteria bacterium]|nr:hypothetical protein [Deltaproteobacteria bacterium]MDQ3297043.1 hypothetical protein [Myxococcota bacterium]